MDLKPYLDSIHSWRPELPLASIEVNPFGLNNLVLKVNDEWICRFPRNPASRENLRREAALLKIIRRHVDIRVPEFIYDAALDFVPYRILKGIPLYRHELLQLDEGLQDRFAADLSGFLRDLHSIPKEELTDGALLPAPSPSTAAIRNVWLNRLGDIRDKLYPFLWADQHAYIEDLFSPIVDGRLDMAAYELVLIHNDLASYHLLSEPSTGRLMGVLDFGEADWGDPAADFGILISTYGESFLDRLNRSHPLTQDAIERARFRAAYIELEWAMKGVESNNPEWFLVHIGRARDSRPFGS